MANNIEVTISAVTNGFEAAMAKVQGHLQNLSESNKGLASKLQSTGQAFSNVGRAILPASVAAGAFVGQSVKLASTYEAQMGKVKAISGATGKEMQLLGSTAKNAISGTTYTATEAAQAYEYMGMAGWKTADMVQGLNPILNLATASGQDLASTSDIVTDALTAFGLQAKDTSMFTDVLAAASTNSNTNVAMMGETFKYAAPIAGALGYSVQDTALAIGLMANAGIKGSQAGTTLRTALTNLANPTAEASRTMQQLGIKTTDAHGKMLPFRDVMGQLREKFKGLTKEQQIQAAETLFGKQAMSGMLAIINASDKDFNNLASSIDNSTGAAKEMAKTMADSQPIQTALASIKEAMRAVGEAVMPTVGKIADGVRKVAEAFGKLPDGAKIAIMGFLGFIAILGPLLIGIGSFITALSQIMIFGPLVGAAIAGMAGPIAIAIAAIAAIVAIGVALYKNWDTIKAKASEVWNGIKETVGKVWEGITEAWSSAWSAIGTALSSAWEGIKSLAMSVWEPIKAALMPIWNVISEVWSTVWSAIVEVLTTIWSAISEVATTVFSAVIEVLTTIWDAISEVWTTVWTAITTVLTTIWNGITTLAMTVWEPVKSFLMTVWDMISGAWSGIWSGISGFLSGIWSGISGIASSIFSGIASFISSAWQLVSSISSSIWNGIKSSLSSMWNGLKTIVSNTWNTIKTIISGAWNIIKTLTSTVWNAIKALITGNTGAIKGIINSGFSNIRSIITAVWNTIKTLTTSTFNAIKSTVTSVLNAIKSTFSNILNAIKSTVTSGMNAVKSAFTNGISQARSAIAGMVGSFVSVGGQIVRGIARGIVSGIGSVISAAVSAVRRAVAAAKAAAGIHSPSKVFNREIGRWIPSGMAVGIEANTDKVEDAARHMIDAANIGAIDLGANMSVTPPRLQDLDMTKEESSVFNITFRLGDRTFKAVAKDIGKINDREIELEEFSLA